MIVEPVQGYNHCGRSLRCHNRPFDIYAAIFPWPPSAGESEDPEAGILGLAGAPWVKTYPLVNSRNDGKSPIFNG